MKWGSKESKYVGLKIVRYLQLQRGFEGVEVDHEFKALHGRELAEVSLRRELTKFRTDRIIDSLQTINKSEKRFRSNASTSSSESLDSLIGLRVGDTTKDGLDGLRNDNKVFL